MQKWWDKEHTRENEDMNQKSITPKVLGIRQQGFDLLFGRKQQTTTTTTMTERQQSTTVTEQQQQ